MSSALLVPVEKLQKETAPWSLRAIELEVTNQATLNVAGNYLRGIKALREEIARTCDPVIKKAYEAHKAAVAQKKNFEAELIEAEKLIKDKVGTFTAEEQRKAREQEALEAAAARETQEKTEAEARELEAAGEHELAEAVLETAETEAAPAAVAAPPTAAGVITRDNWSAEVTDFRALVDAVAKGDVPLAVLKIDQKVLNQQARSLKRELHWPGVRVKNAKVTSVRG